MSVKELIFILSLLWCGQSHLEFNGTRLIGGVFKNMCKLPREVMIGTRTSEGAAAASVTVALTARITFQ